MGGGGWGLGVRCWRGLVGVRRAAAAAAAGVFFFSFVFVFTRFCLFFVCFLSCFFLLIFR